MGTEGDARTALSLARSLREAGHDVTSSITSEDARDRSALAGRLGIEVRPTSYPRLTEAGVREFGQEILRV